MDLSLAFWAILHKYCPKGKRQIHIALGDSNLDHLLKHIERAMQWADLIEIRLDKLLHFDLNAIALIEEKARCPLIWVLRKASHGGDFRGSEQERYEILRSLLLKCRPAFIDLEADTPEKHDS